MLPKINRISKEYFQYILKNGKRYNSENLILYLAPTPQGESKASKFAFSVSKKVAPLAVDRNKYRRWGYVVVSRHIKHIKPGYLFFFSFKKSKNKISFSVLNKEIEELLRLSNMQSNMLV